MRWARYSVLYVLYCLFYFLLEKLIKSDSSKTIPDILISGIFFVVFFAVIEGFINSRAK